LIDFFCPFANHSIYENRSVNPLHSNLTTESEGSYIENKKAAAA